MGHLFRSEDMSLLQFIIPSDACYESIGELGELGVVQFKDLNGEVNVFQRNFVKELRVCDEMERRLRVFGKQMDDAGICNAQEDLLDVDSYKKFRLPMQHEVDELSDQLLKLEGEVLEMKENQNELERNYLELTELRHILIGTRSFFSEAERHDFASDVDPDVAQLIDLEGGGSRGVRLGFLTGVVRRQNFAAFEKVLWRGCSGNVFLRAAEIPESEADNILNKEEHVNKIVFTVFFQGTALENKVKRICDGFNCTLYACPDTVSKREELLQRVQGSLDDLNMVLQRTTEYRMRVLKEIATQYEGWAVRVRKVKLTYYSMNMFNFDVTNSALIAEGWVPTNSIAEVTERLNIVTSRLDAGVNTIVREVRTRAQPPTYHITNKVTYGFQNLIDSYGIASYKEVNPGLFTIITFPFLFAVMFGDFGHGFLMAMAALYLIWHEDYYNKAKGMGEMFMTVFWGRYVVFMMGLFSIYTGFIYNDIFSKSVWIFNSGWVFPDINLANENVTAIDLPNRLMSNFSGCAVQQFGSNVTCGYSGQPYYFGMDPIWSMTTNKLSYLNAFKMKMSVLMGVTHMMFGTVLSVFNHYHKRSFVGFFGEFIPQVIFMMGIFGYLCILIVFKWLSDYSEDSLKAPALLKTLINMFLKAMSNTDETMRDDYLLAYEGQAFVQKLLLVFALLMVPIMLLARPLTTYFHMKKRRAQGYEQVGHGEEDDGEEEHGMSEVVVHSCIHTIEYCLGCVSNTASYLRLWALSLAHAQLSEVLWKFLSGAFASWFKLYILFTFWAVLTVAVLLMMEGMSAFLHALRLHWVEFNGKFYQGEGHQFEPFTYETMFEEQS